MDIKWIFRFAEEIAKGTFPKTPGADPLAPETILGIARIVAQCEQRTVQEKWNLKIEEMLDRFLESKMRRIATGQHLGISDAEADRGLLYVDKDNALCFSLCGNVGEEAKERVWIRENGGAVRALYNKAVE